MTLPLQPVPAADPESPAGDAAYREALGFLYGRIDYERTPPSGNAGAAFKLERMQTLLSRLGQPQESVPCVHIAGSKGKGSTAAMLSAMLTAAGHRTGLFTSPHIHRFEERVQIDGEPISRERFVRHLQRLQPLAREMDAHETGGPTFFELTTALGWLEFAERQVDVVVLEVGLGGRLDATNVCRPLACLITSISRDHTRLLGETHELIAREKAGIIKPGVPVFTAVEEPGPLAVITDLSRANNAPCHVLNQDIHWIAADVGSHNNDHPSQRHIDVTTPWRRHAALAVPLPGQHQSRNTALAVAVADWLDSSSPLKVPEPALREGLANVHWPLRIETVRSRPRLILDAAHNIASIDALIETLREFPARRRIAIFGTSKDKEAARMLARLSPAFDELILTQFLSNPRATPVESLARLAEKELSRVCHTAPTPAAALELADHLAAPDDLICLTGSFFLAAEAREIVLGPVTIEHSASSPEAPISPGNLPGGTP